MKWEVAEGTFSSEQTYQEDQDIWYKGVKISVSFDKPPLVLNPGLRYKVKASFSKNNGTLNHGYEGLGETFLWTGGKIEPAEKLSYFPWLKNFNGVTSKEWMISAPPATRVGDILVIGASMLNWPAGVVQWTYKAEIH